MNNERTPELHGAALFLFTHARTHARTTAGRTPHSIHTHPTQSTPHTTPHYTTPTPHHTTPYHANAHTHTCPRVDDEINPIYDIHGICGYADMQ